MARRRRRRTTRDYYGPGDLGAIDQKTALTGILVLGGIGAVAALALSASKTPGSMLYRPPPQPTVNKDTQKVRDIAETTGAVLDFAGDFFSRIGAWAGGNKQPQPSTTVEQVSGLAGLGAFDRAGALGLPRDVPRPPQFGSRARAPWAMG
jgi:hypothetical protein